MARRAVADKMSRHVPVSAFVARGLALHRNMYFIPLGIFLFAIQPCRPGWNVGPHLGVPQPIPVTPVTSSAAACRAFVTTHPQEPAHVTTPRKAERKHNERIGIARL
jgi:hypothetical protein